MPQINTPNIFHNDVGSIVLRKKALNTDDFRKPAIKIYLGLGYRPYLYDDDMAERWHALMDYYGIDELEAYDKDLNDLTMYSKIFTDR